jgi:hypothetical protein
MKGWHEIFMYAAVTIMTIEVIFAAAMRGGRLPGTIVEALAGISLTGAATLVQIHRSRTDRQIAMAFGILFVMAAGCLLLALSAPPNCPQVG